MNWRIGTDGGLYCSGRMDKWVRTIVSWFTADFPGCPPEIRSEMVNHYLVAAIVLLGLDMHIKWKRSIFTRWKLRGLEPLQDGNTDIRESLQVLDYLVGKMSQKEFDSWAVEGRVHVKEMIEGTHARSGFTWHKDVNQPDAK